MVHLYFIDTSEANASNINIFKTNFLLLPTVFEAVRILVPSTCRILPRLIIVSNNFAFCELILFQAKPHYA